MQSAGITPDQRVVDTIRSTRVPHMDSLLACWIPHRKKCIPWPCFYFISQFYYLIINKTTLRLNKAWFVRYCFIWGDMKACTSVLAALINDFIEHMLYRVHDCLYISLDQWIRCVASYSYPNEYTMDITPKVLQWRHISIKASQTTGNMTVQHFVHAYNALFMHTTKKTLKLHFTSPPWGKFMGVRWIPLQRKTFPSRVVTMA